MYTPCGRGQRTVRSETRGTTQSDRRFGVTQDRTPRNLAQRPAGVTGSGEAAIGSTVEGYRPPAQSLLFSPFKVTASLGGCTAALAPVPGVSWDLKEWYCLPRGQGGQGHDPHAVPPRCCVPSQALCLTPDRSVNPGPYQSPYLLFPSFSSLPTPCTKGGQG